jgi:hypothetical protein
VLDVTAKDAQGVQVFGESKTFNMIGYTQKDRQGEKTVDNWLIRSFEDKALQPGKTTHTFEVKLPAGVDEVDVRAALTYIVADKVTPMTEASQKISVAQTKK